MFLNFQILVYGIGWLVLKIQIMPLSEKIDTLMLNNTDFVMDFNVLIGNLTTASRDKTQGLCGDWKDAQHYLFQLANLCLILSFLIPNRFRHHPLCLRLFLGLGYLFFSLWSGLIVCMPDVLGWSAAFFLVNLLYFCYIGYRILPSRANKHLDELYKNLFEPLQVSKMEYDCLVKQGFIHELERCDQYATEGITRCGQRTSILVKGRYAIVLTFICLDSLEAVQGHLVYPLSNQVINRLLRKSTNLC